VNAEEALRRSFRDLRTVRAATIGPDGGPRVAALWFVWLQDAIYVAVSRGSAAWNNVERDPRVGLVLDKGADWNELAGVSIEGKAEPFPAEHPDVRAAMSAWLEKYRTALSGDGFERMTKAVPSLGFLRVVPESMEIWDHAARDRDPSG
jgi:Pyridoxamine 5'-phosphate oxidase